MLQPLVLAIEPDLRQAAIVKRIVREKVLADVAVVDSRDAAIEAMRTCMPDVLLLSALLSPRDEDELITHLKTLENAGHLQTHTIPQLASALQPGEGRGARGLLSAFRRKKDPGPANGCDPDMFADEIKVFLKRAAERKRELQDSDHAAPDMRPSPAGASKVAAPVDGDAPAPHASSWSSPFEWKPGASSSRNIPSIDPAANPSSLIPDPGSLIANPASLIADPASLIADPASLIADPASLIADPASVIANPASLIADPTSVIADPASVANPVSVLATPEPPAAEFVSPIATREPLIPQPPFPISSTPLIPEPEAPVAAFAAPTVAAEPAIPEPVSLVVESAPSIPELQAAVAEPVIAATPAPDAKPARYEAPRRRDSGFRIKDSGFRIKDSGSAIRDEGLVALGFAPLGLWVRREGEAPGKADGREDVRALLSTLAVPRAVAAVSYPRGCRIRRVRVPAVPEADGGEAPAAVIASRGAAADHRDRRPSA